MIGDMYTDLERSIFIALTAAKTALGSSAEIHTQQVVVPEIGQDNRPLVINFTKIMDRPAPENGGGPRAEIVNKDTEGMTASVSPWADPYQVTYDFVVYSDNLEGMRKAEVVIKTAIQHRKPFYIYDTNDEENPVKTQSYCDVNYTLYINRDDTVERRYQRHQQIVFEPFNFSIQAPKVKVLISKVAADIYVPTVQDQLEP